MPYIPRELNLVPDTDGEPTYRASMLPIATYANPDGSGQHFGFAVPGMIQEPVNALMNLFGHGNFAKGPDYPGNADDMRTLLFSMYGGNALNPAAMLPEGALGANALKYLKRSATEITPETASLMTSPDRVRVQPDLRSERRITGDPTYGPGDSLTPSGFDFWFGAKPNSVDDYAEYAGGFHNQNGLENTIRNQLSEINDFERLGHLTPEQAQINRDHLSGLLGRVTDEDFNGSLLSDTGKPSLMGSALSPYSQEPRNALLGY